VFFTRGSASNCQWFRRNRSKLSGTKFATTVLCGCSNTSFAISLKLWIALKTLFINSFDLLLPLCYGTLWPWVPWPTQTYVKGSAAEKWFKNAALASFATCLCRQRSGYSLVHDTRTVNPVLVQCQCHTGKSTVIATIKWINRNLTANFSFSRNFRFSVPISKGGGKCPFCPPCERPWLHYIYLNQVR